MIELIVCIDRMMAMSSTTAMRPFVGQLAALAVSRKAKPRPQYGGIALDKGVTLIADHRGGSGLPSSCFSLGLLSNSSSGRCAALK